LPEIMFKIKIISKAIGSIKDEEIDKIIRESIR
jgi:hypothetical protein